jgi:hypothetical protein
MVHILDLMDNEWCFSLGFFFEKKLCNYLNPHFKLLVAMYAQKFFMLENFPYQTTYDM